MSGSQTPGKEMSNAELVQQLFMGTELAVLISSGREFQSFGALIDKARSPLERSREGAQQEGPDLRNEGNGPGHKIALWRWLRSLLYEDRVVLFYVTEVRLLSELYKRLTGQDRINAFKRECILGMAEFIRQNPRATEAQINSELEKRVLLFAASVQALT